MKKGDKASKNFVLDWKIETMQQLEFALDNYKSIFWRFKVFPIAFLQNWSFHRLKIEIKAGRLWAIRKNDANQQNLH